MSTRIGIDAGTSAAKAVAFDASGGIIRRAEVSMPRLHASGDAVAQPLDATVAAIEAAVTALDVTGPVDLIALTTQRDTAIVLDDAGRPVTDVVSWRDTRHAAHGSLWTALRAEGTLPAGTFRVRSLASFLTERWTGRAAETPATRPRHQAPAAIDTIGAPVDLPVVLPAGAFVGRVCAGRALPAGAPLHLTAGDKNAELLGAGVEGPGSSGLSLGSAISLGSAVRGTRPAAPRGTVVTPAALDAVWNVETGLVVGTTLLDGLRGLTGVPDLAPDGRWRDTLRFVPLPAGGLDDPTARAAIEGLTEHTRPEDLARAWAQGVACELARLAPLLVSAVDAAFAEIRLYGGGADRLWQRLLADVLDTPVRLIDDDAACGARGAVLCALLRRGDDTAAAALRDARPPGTLATPDPALRAFVADYRANYDRLRTAGSAR